MISDPLISMNISWQYFFIILILIIIVIILYCNYFSAKNKINKKLMWIPRVPGYPFLGNILQLSNTTTILENVQELLLQNNGIWRTKFLNEHNIFVSNQNFLEWMLSSSQIIDKGSVYAFLHNWLDEGLLISGGEIWKKTRRILTPSFNVKILEQYVQTFDNATAILIEILNKEINNNDNDDDIEVQDFMLNFTLDVLCQTFMGLQLNIQKDHNSDYSNSVHGINRIIMNRSFSLFKRNDFFYRFTKDFYKERKFLKLLHATSNRVINIRRKELNDNKDINNDMTKKKMDLLNLLINYRDENGNSLSQTFIRREVDTIMFAGHTTASALSFALYCLSINPQVQITALKEIEEILGKNNRNNNKALTYQDLQEMKYLEAVIKESLRLYPAVPFFSRQVKNDIFYQENKCIPKNSIIIVAAYAVHRDPKNYSKPDEFIPERFFENNVKPFTYVPFSAGPRNCIGQKFSMLKMKSALVKILLNFELKPAKPPYKPILSAELALKSINGIKVQFKKKAI